MDIQPREIVSAMAIVLDCYRSNKITENEMGLIMSVIIAGYPSLHETIIEAATDMGLIRATDLN